MIRILGRIPCDAVEVEADPWIPLSVKWNLSERSALLNLYVRGTAGGYVELRVDEHTGAVREVVVVDAPPRSEISPELLDKMDATETIAIVRDLWEWKITPDYEEPASREAALLQHLSWSMNDDRIVLVFSEDDASWLVGGSDAEFGVSASGELVHMAVRRPAVELPAAYPV